MKESYDFSKMKRVPHPFQAKIDSGEIKLKSHFDISDAEFQKKLKNVNEEQREIIIEMRQQWKEEQLLQEISQVEKSCNSPIPLEIVSLLDKIKSHLVHKIP